MLLSCQNIDKSFLDNHILNSVCFHLNEYDKAALIGINGSGKTTLIRIIMGELSPDDGFVTFSKDKTIGYLPQNALLSSSRSIYDEVLSVKKEIISLEEQIHDMEDKMKHLSGNELEILMNQYTNALHTFELNGGYIYKSEVVGILKGLGFSESDFNQSINTLSGGQKTRVALGKLLLNKPDLIILDEPTNHLDMNSIVWLENYLLNYKGTVLIVSHDRYFLDKIVNKVIELEFGNLTTFSGNYTDYAKKKEILRNSALNAYYNQQREIKHQEEVIEKLRSFNREKSIKRADSREKMLNKIQVIDKPIENTDKMNIKLSPVIESGNDVLDVQMLSKSFGKNILFENLSFFIKKGEHVAIIGDNGTGKTTLLKIINNITDADNGVIKTGSNVTIGYYDQEHHVLNETNTIFDEISDAYPTLTNTEIRNVLAAFLFTGEDVFKLISSLSGGEKGRVSLAKLMLSEANFLILDEPTNHLDITSKEILEDAINSYNGTILYVSHDRYFINRSASRILELSLKDMKNYLGNYDYYMEKKSQLIINNEYCEAEPTITESKTDWKVQKEIQAKQRKRENDKMKVESLIEELEKRQKEIDTLMITDNICNNVSKLIELQKEKETNDEELLNLYEKWDDLA